jgi:hypothetical protein
LNYIKLGREEQKYKRISNRKVINIGRFKGDPEELTKINN